MCCSCFTMDFRVLIRQYPSSTNLMSLNYHQKSTNRQTNIPAKMKILASNKMKLRCWDVFTLEFVHLLDCLCDECLCEASVRSKDLCHENIARYLYQTCTNYPDSMNSTGKSSLPCAIPIKRSWRGEGACMINVQHHLIGIHFTLD